MSGWGDFMRRLVIFSFVLFGTFALALNNFYLQTGGSGVIARGYNSAFGSPSDLYGILNSAFSTSFTEVTRSTPAIVHERHLHVQLFEDSDDGMAGMLQYYMDIGPDSKLRSLSYTISGGLGVLTNYGIDLKVNMEVDTDTTYGVVVKGGISGKAFELMEYVAAFETTLWTSGSTANAVDLLAGIRFVPGPFVIGVELGTRFGMDVRYFGLSTQYTYNQMFSARGGASVNLDFLNNIDFLVGAGIDVKIGNMIITSGMGTNLSKTIDSLNYDLIWNVGLLGQW
jgi:hypothetical protein